MVCELKKLSVFIITLVVVFSHLGCKYAPFIGLFGTESYHERTVPAEYNLTEHTDQKVLVLVDQPGWLDAQLNLRYYLTQAINMDLVRRIEIPGDSLVSYSELSEFRSNQSDFSLLSPAEIGAAFDANMVLLVMVEDYELNEMAETNYYKGFLGVQAVLLDTAKEEKLWPQLAKSKSIEVGFEVESRGQEVAVGRLASACAFCTTRYLYNCPKKKFTIAEDRSTIAWKKWGR
ncbi:MAG: hypothetical protein JSV82_01805 [Planctomycetota bacterium]|nr:MAG: hypothetical protein JSV82_01805 [Planctomycetota bacterium]